MDQASLQRIKQRYDIIGNSDALNRAIETALKIAPVDLSVLVSGENGAGKEIFPRIIHDNSTRKGKKYFAINCGAIPEGTIDSELFGHEKGSFTGAIDSREGYFSVANGGTLFLDEVGEPPLSTQARLLRVLETGEYIRVGSSEVRKTNVRIVAATNVKMDKAVADGKFREDLYYRLNTIPIYVPPLRERGEDIVTLFRKFALDMSEKYKMPAIRLNDEARRALLAYSWPGNVRQLKNITENMSVTSEEREVTAEVLRRYLPREAAHTQLAVVDEKKDAHSFENEREILYQILFDLRRDVSELKRIVRSGREDEKFPPSVNRNDTGSYFYDTTPTVSVAGKADEDVPYWEAEEVKDEEADYEEKRTVSGRNEQGETSMKLDDVERDMIARALQSHHGRRKAAADELGISERTLYRKIKEYGLDL